jgi:hypothetical protein
MELRRFGSELQGRKLRLFFSDGEVSEGVIVSAPTHSSCEGCDGFVYDLESTNRPAKYEAMRVKVGSALWTKFDEFAKYEILEG